MAGPADRQQQGDKRPWWLEEGDELCPHCGQRYHLEMERRCAACDAQSCAHCLDEHHRHCPDCAAGGTS